MLGNPASAAAVARVQPTCSRAIKNSPITATLKRRYGSANWGNKDTVRRQGDIDNGAHGSIRQSPHPPGCGGRSHVRSAPAQFGTADNDPDDNDSGRQSLRCTVGWIRRRGVAFAQDLLGELALAERTPENGSTVKPST